MSAPLSAYGNELLVDWDCKKPMLEKVAMFAYLTGKGTKEKPGYMDKYATAMALKQRREWLESRVKEGSIEAIEQLRETPAPDPLHLRPPEEVVIVHHKCFENCSHRLMAARATSWGYEYAAFPTRSHFIDAAVATAKSMSGNAWFVIVEFDTPLYLYMDFEEDRGPITSPSKNEREFFQRCSMGVTFILGCIETIYGIDVAKMFRAPERTYWTSACTLTKHSFHCHIKIPFESVNVLLLLMEFAKHALVKLHKLSPDHPLVTAMRNVNGKKSERSNPWIIDFGVYNGHRNFRATWQRKYGKTEGELIPFDPKKGERIKVTSDKDFRRWIKRSLIVLSNERQKKVMCLPERIVGESLQETIKKICTDFVTYPTTISCLDRCFDFILKAYYDYEDPNESEKALICIEAAKERVKTVVTERVLSKFVASSAEKRWLIARALLRHLSQNRCNPVNILCIETVLSILDGMAQPIRAWYRMLYGDSMPSEELDAMVSSRLTADYDTSATKISCFELLVHRFTKKKAAKDWLERIFSTTDSSPVAKKTIVKPVPAREESAPITKKRPRVLELENEEKPRHRSKKLKNSEDRPKISDPLLQWTINIDTLIEPITAPWAPGTRKDFLQSIRQAAKAQVDNPTTQQ